MGTVVCQGLQSCLESQIAESRTLRLRLSAPKPSSESPGWGSIQTLTDPTHFLKPAPMVLKRCVSSCLSDKSLELCTENLGSETGADQQLFFSDPHHDSNYYLFSSEQRIIGNSDEKATESPAAVKKSRTAPRGNGFPPPLTTMRGPELIKVRPHREGGRLVMKAVKLQSPPSCFQAERIDSRLRLHVVVDHSLDTAFDYSASTVTECNDNDNNTNYAEENEIREEEGMERRNTSHHHYHHHDQHQHENVNYVSSDDRKKGGLLLNWEPFRVATALQV